MKLFEQPWYWFTNTTIATLSTILVILLCIFHSYKVLIDLCTKNAITLNMSADKYKIYKLVSIFTITSIVLFSTVMFLTSIISWCFVYEHCLILTTLSTLLYVYSKVTMYLVFLMRLDMVYGNTICEYGRKYLITAGIFTILYMTILSVFHILTYSVQPYKYHHIPFPAIKCNSVYNKYVIIVLGAYDIIASICFVIAFVRPLHCLLATHATQQKKSGTQKTIQQQGKITNFTKDILILGFKATILTASACLSTIILLVFIIVSPIGNIFVGIDVIINVISLMLMTTYYRDNKYFLILCCCMIKLCKTSVIRDHEQWSKFERELSIKTHSKIQQTEQNNNDHKIKIKSITVTNPAGFDYECRLSNSRNDIAKIADGIDNNNNVIIDNNNAAMFSVQ